MQDELANPTIEGVAEYAAVEASYLSGRRAAVALVGLAASASCFLTAESLPIGLLPQISSSMHTSLSATGLLVTSVVVSGAFAAQSPVGLGTADSFAVLAGSTVTNTGPSTINGNLGVSPGTAVTGFPPGTVNGTIHAADAVAGQAQTDLTTAYNDAAARTPAATVSGDLGGQTLTAGVYKSASSL